MQQMVSKKKISFRIESTRSQIAFVMVCVLISRAIIILSFFIWKERIGFEGGFFDAFSRYDSVWYQSIINDGYALEPFAGDKLDSSNWAFFPFFPLMLRAVHLLLPLDYNLLGFIVNSIFFAMALVMAMKYIFLTRNSKSQAILFVLLMSFGIYNFYFSTLYTESMFLFFIVSFFYCMEKNYYIGMGWMGAFASATRSTGIMLVFAAAIHCIHDYCKLYPFSIKGFLLKHLGNSKLVLGITLIPAGLFSYMLYLYLLVGDSMAFVNIQKAWGRADITNPIKVLFNSLTNINSFVFYLSLWSVWGIYCAWLLLNRKRYAEFVMTLLFVFIPLSTSVDSMPRYIIGSFLPLLAYTDELSDSPRYKLAAICFLSFVFSFICLNGWFGSEAFVM